MGWSLTAAVAVVGLVIGFFFRAPALLALTLVIVLGSFAAIWIFDFAPAHALKSGFLLIVIEHVAYLIGLAAVVGLKRLHGNA